MTGRYWVGVYLVVLISVLLPTVVVAQTSTTHRVGFLTPAATSSMKARYDQFVEGLRELGYIEGHNLQLDYKSAEENGQTLGQLVDEQLRKKPDVMVTHGVLATSVVRQRTRELPIVCFACGDAVASGLAASLARPGGNVTGVTIQAPDASAKRLQILKELVPGFDTLGVLANADNPITRSELSEAEQASRAAGIRIVPVMARSSVELDRAFEELAAHRAQAVLVLSDAMLYGNRARLAEMALARRLASMSWSDEFAKAGFLASYGPDVMALAKLAATFVDKILKGRRPFDLPFQQPTKFDLTINVNTARSLGIAVPAAMLVYASEVIDQR